MAVGYSILESILSDKQIKLNVHYTFANNTLKIGRWNVYIIEDFEWQHVVYMLFIYIYISFILKQHCKSSMLHIEYWYMF